MPFQRAQLSFFSLFTIVFLPNSSHNMQAIGTYGRYPHTLFLVPFLKILAKFTQHMVIRTFGFEGHFTGTLF